MSQDKEPGGKPSEEPQGGEVSPEAKVGCALLCVVLCVICFATCSRGCSDYDDRWDRLEHSVKTDPYYQQW